MATNVFAVLVVLVASAAYSNGLTIGRFDNLTTGIWDAWNNSDPSNVNQGRFAMQYGNDKLRLISRRLHRPNFEDPWDPAARGGIVSTYNLPTHTWTHHQYGRLDEDQYGDKIFSLNGRLFMLTYSTNQKKIVYHKLFFWDDDTSRWLETPFDIDPTASTLTTNSIAQLSVVAPSQAGKVAYFVASAHAYAQRGSEIVFSKLDVDFRGNVPVKATLKPIAREESQEPSAVMFTAIKDDVLYAFIENFYSEGYVSVYDFAYALDLKTNHLGNVTLAGAHPPMEYNEEGMFQTKDQVFIAGGSQVVGLGHFRRVKDIWSLNLSTFQWTGTNAMLPEVGAELLAYDQSKGKLYAADLREGIKVAQVTV